MAAPLPDAQTPLLARKWGTGLFTGGAIALAALELYFASAAEVRSPIHLELGLAILFFAGLPSLLWAKRGRASLPVFETLMLTTANAYALPLLNGHSELIFYTPEDITTAALAVIAFQVAAILAYEVTQGRPSTHEFWRSEVVSNDIGRWLTYGMVLNTTYVILGQFTQLIPAQFESILRAIFFGIGIVCTFISSRRLGAGQLAPGERTFFLCNLTIQCLVMITPLYLVGSISTLLLALVGYVSGSGRIPLITIGGLLVCLAILHNGKADMRAKYWEGGYPAPGITQLPGFFTEWVQNGVRVGDEEHRSKITAKLIERTSLFHVMCLVVSVTPAQQPFLEGETYKDIPAQFVPRIFWPEKPLGHVSTSKLAVYYGLQTEEDTQKTTIGFGMVTEAYANFGFYGIVAVAALLGFGIKKLQCWAIDSPLFSYGGLVLVVLLAWSFQSEFTLSIWLASLYQACVAVLIIPFALKRVFAV